ncbi:ATP-dependent RecD-like DNA helicase [Angelakisella massiliensis]|uniref:SF1B family DNA helicase RecD2 n=1 Tax=Angelakisella massiliensis TaxID=1871018 RepID=UPI0023A7EB28|nr:ATP-dependent RecD-like DNA helicase [Angelakisella massiliensis]
MSEKEIQRLEGSVEDIIFHNEDTGFTVLAVGVGDELITVVGETSLVGEGEEIAVTGYFTSHPTYGSQFKAQTIERTLPSTAAAIGKYLASGAIKGVGPALAKRLVAQFGDRTLEVMEKQPEALTAVRGISPAKAKSINEEFVRLYGIRSVMLFLSRYGIQPAMAIRVWKRWGNVTEETVRNNPYVLCCEEVGLDFQSADLMAEEFGIPHDGYCRVSAGVAYVLRHNTHNGHVCLPLEKLSDLTAQYLDVPRHQVEDAIQSMAEDNTLALYDRDGRHFVYLAELYGAESYIAGRIALLFQLQNPEPEDHTSEIDQLEAELQIQYDQLQKKAIGEALSNNLFILTGGPGTGKTTTLNGILTLLERQGMKVALAAPTGRAAKRMTEVTGREAKTIHRLLEVDPGRDSLTFKRNERNPLPVDAVIIDEMSMVDTLILESLFRGMKLSSKLILVGDSDQLPSVAAGNVLKDLIDSDVVPTVHLDRVFRQAAESLIVTNAHAIVHGELPVLDRKDKDFFFLRCQSQQQAQDLTVDLCVRRLPNSYHYSPLWDIQIIVPGKKGPLGTQELNRRMQEALNPPDRNKSQLNSLGRILREGDKVMQIRNNYDITYRMDSGEEGMGIFNGDIGVIEMLDPSSKTILVRFDDRVAQYSFDNADQLEHAYAITVHKSQGSEFQAVVMPLMQRHPKLHYRNLLYTGVTRARSLLVMDGDPGTVAEMVENDRRTLRYTNLKEMLREAVSPQQVLG